MPSFFGELRRRNVFRVGIAYLAAVWLLIQVADVVLSNFAAPAWIIQALIFSLALGFPFVLALAWFYELTPEGVKAASDLEVVEGVKFTGRKLDFAIIGLLVLAVGFLLGRDYVLDRPGDLVLTDENQPSIAVLPFVNMSSDPEQEYFSDGISEELLNLLAQVPNFRVISRSSAFVFKGKAIDIPTVAEQLNVRHVLEGSVRKSGDEVRITVQLIDARSDSHLWSETYDRTLEDIFAVQDEIAASVLEQLQVTLLGAAPELDPTDPEAYALYLQAHHILNQGLTDAFPVAERALNQALAIDPDYVPALLELGWLYWSEATRELRPRQEALRLFRRLLEQALEADPESGPVHATLAWIGDGELSDVARHAERAMALDPTNTDSLQLMIGVVRNLGYPEEALYLAEYVVARDPTCIQCLRRLAEAYQIAVRLDEAEATIRTSQSLSPGRDPEHDTLAGILLLKGEPTAALAEYEQIDDEEDRILGITLALYDLGRQEEFEASFEELQETWSRNALTVYAHMGEADLAFEDLDRRLDSGGSPTRIAYDPFFSKMRADPRWPGVLERMGVSPDQLRALDFQITLPQ